MAGGQPEVKQAPGCSLGWDALPTCLRRPALAGLLRDSGDLREAQVRRGIAGPAETTATASGPEDEPRGRPEEDEGPDGPKPGVDLQNIRIAINSRDPIQGGI